MENQNGTLSHFGILGMHWGHRKASSTSSSSSPEKKHSSNSEEHTRVNELKRKKPSELSNAEMQAVITRMNLEKQYSELTRRKVSSGEKFVTDLLIKSGTQMANKYAEQYASKGMEALLKGVAKT